MQSLIILIANGRVRNEVANSAMRSGRNVKGAIIPLVLVSTLVFIGLGFLFLQTIVCFGSSVEVRNATDAGALNLGRKATTLRVKVEQQAEREFEDVAADDGSFGLDNINRVWAVALLAAINVEAMRNNGQSSYEAEEHCRVLFDAASSLARRLNGQLKNKDNLERLFEELSKVNSCRMTGDDSTRAASGKWRCSYLDRGLESNIDLGAEQLPAGFDKSRLHPVESKNSLQNKASDGSKKVYLPGYKELKVMDKTFVFVPFQENTQPHLISGKTFDDNSLDKGALLALPETASPNAFAAEGKSKALALNGAALADDGAYSAFAFVVANPQKSFRLRKPHGFIRISFEEPRVKFMVNSIPQVQSYPMRAGSTRISIPVPAGSGTLHVNATVGNEYQDRSLKHALFAVAGANYERVITALVQRGKEIDPDFSKSDLFKLLENQNLEDGILEYYILAKSNKSEKLEIRPANKLPAFVNKNAVADGKASMFAEEFESGKPNEASYYLIGEGVQEYTLQQLELRGRQLWRPASGFSGCLGELKIERNTEITAIGFVI